MKRTLILVVDRDDDFGVKAKIQTPAIGLDAVLYAAIALGTVDPEDSDVNAAYAAVKIYNEMKAEKRDVEIALICGDTKVGHRSDIKIGDELEAVIEKVSPERAVLVSDGAEDEYVYPIITSRLKVDSVKKVYVKQAPGLEGAFYVLTRILHDSDKRKKLLVPISVIIMAIALVMMIPSFMGYRDTGNLSEIYNSIGIIVAFTIGLIIFMYAYRVGEWVVNYAKRMLTNIKSGDPTVIFTIIAVALFCIGIIIGVSAARAPPGIDDGHRALIFLSNSLWVLAFAYICNDFGKFLERYMEDRKIILGFMVGTMMILGAAFIIQGSIDSLAALFGYNIADQDMIMIEFVIGSAFAAAAGITQVSYKRFINSQKNRMTDDALQ
jgi:putative membrane protein